MTQGFSEKDWKLFRSKAADWQEAYMERLNKEYIELLNGEGSPSDKFWQLDKRLREDEKSHGVQMEMRRSKMLFNIISLLQDGVISLGDLDDFSDELKESVRAIAARSSDSVS